MSFKLPCSPPYPPLRRTGDGWWVLLADTGPRPELGGPCPWLYWGLQQTLNSETWLHAGPVALPPLPAAGRQGIALSLALLTAAHVGPMRGTHVGALAQHARALQQARQQHACGPELCSAPVDVCPACCQAHECSCTFLLASWPAPCSFASSFAFALLILSRAACEQPGCPWVLVPTAPHAVHLHSQRQTQLW